MRLLLHSCCASCSTSVIEQLKDEFDITVIYYNPNIEPIEEYEKRKETQINFLKQIKIDYVNIDYLNGEFKERIKGDENEPENGQRCSKCYELRLEKTAVIALENDFNYFCTTLSVSPHKNTKLINEIGLDLEKKYKVKYLQSDFKKNDGYQRSINLAKEYNLYRQKYCGCLYSKGE